MIWLAMIGAGVGAALASIRWLRVAQREHYLPPAVSRFAWQWWKVSPLNQALGLLAFVGLAGSFILDPRLAWIAMVAVIAPVGLSWRGRTSELAWTGRLRRLAILAGLLVAILIAWSAEIGHPGPAMAAVVGLPLLTDVGLWLAQPTERRLGEKWVTKAKERLKGSGARVVGITGSYGKTTTKAYLGHLLSGFKATTLTPASFNNRLGIARAINEQLVSGTEVFVAEMGTYGPGEIADLCSLAPPEIAVITAIGPVHLERFGSEEKIALAKAEILADAKVAVLNVDHPLLADLAGRFGGDVVRCSALGRGANVAVVDGSVWIDEREVGVVGAEVFAANLACAIGAARALGTSVDHIVGRLQDLPVTAHRRHVSVSDRGVTVIDDTYNSNPAGARAALDTLLGVPGDGRRVVVTPGMVELGDEQWRANEEFATAVSAEATDLVVVGRTNRRALAEGAGTGRALVTVVDSRSRAVEWVRAHLGPGDSVLYENDLPDHYP